MTDLLPYPSPNYRRGRRAAITHVILHTCESDSLDGCLSTLTDPYRVNEDGDLARVSAHYVVDDSGIYHLVNEEDEAWAAGAANRYGINIEVVGYADSPATWTDAKLDHLAELLADVTQRNAIPLVYRDTATDAPLDRGIVAHGALDPARRSDPGIFFPWNDVKSRISRLRGAFPAPATAAGLAFVAAAIAVWVTR